MSDVRIPDSNLQEIVVTDTIKPDRPINIDSLRYVSIASLLARAIVNVHNEESVSSLLFEEAWEDNEWML